MPPLVDYHVHTARCGHALGSMEQYVEHAIASGLREVGFSDHLYLYWVEPDERDPELGMAEWELDFYVEDVERCRQRYGRDITIRLSTEADFVPGFERDLEGILRRYDWDYVIGSVHFIDGWGFDDSRKLAGYAEWDIDALYARYFELVGQSAETGLFDTIGHADLVKKFGYRARSDQSQAYAQLAQRFARGGVCVEVNTSGLRKPVCEVYPHLDLLQACRAAGVPTTFASDAHAPHEVGADIAAACDLLRAAGYDRYIAFAGRAREERLLA
ncbi:MAG TPA: histidinol-phosphatase HisJ family protein [Chloroflexota bacterium]|nr:histidinol-phosphatase HisJ family protein [Chloroflexota bacterium]